MLAKDQMRYSTHGNIQGQLHGKQVLDKPDRNLTTDVLHEGKVITRCSAVGDKVVSNVLCASVALAWFD